MSDIDKLGEGYLKQMFELAQQDRRDQKASEKRMEAKDNAKTWTDMGFQAVEDAVGQAGEYVTNWNQMYHKKELKAQAQDLGVEDPYPTADSDWESFAEITRESNDIDRESTRGIIDVLRNREPGDLADAEKEIDAAGQEIDKA